MTLRLASNPGDDTLGGTLTAMAADGLAVFSGLTLSHADVGYTLMATTDGPAATFTDPFNVTAAAPAQLAIATSAPVGNAIGVTVSVEDSYGNLVSTLTGSVRLETSGNAAHTAPHHKSSSTPASQKANTFTVIKLGTKGRSYALEVNTDGLEATTVISLESKSHVAKSRKDPIQVVRDVPKARPALHHAAFVSHR